MQTLEEMCQVITTQDTAALPKEPCIFMAGLLPVSFLSLCACLQAADTDFPSQRLSTTVSLTLFGFQISLPSGQGTRFPQPGSASGHLPLTQDSISRITCNGQANRVLHMAAWLFRGLGWITSIYPLSPESLLPSQAYWYTSTSHGLISRTHLGSNSGSCHFRFSR